MRKVPILREGNVQLSFDEIDVRQVCSMMRCGRVAEECIGRMMDRTMECMLCYMALRVLKTPCQVEGEEFRAMQLN